MIGIYLLKQKEEVVYVGQSVDVDLRLATHKREGLKEFDNVYIIECDRENLDSAEAFYIHYYIPKYNKKTYMLNINSGTPKVIKEKKKKENIVIATYLKPTNINIAKYYGVTPEILSYYDNNKRGIEKKRMYDAMKEYYIRNEVLKDGNSSCFEHQVSEVLLKNNKDK